MQAPTQRPRELRWYHAAGLLFGDLGTSRLYVLGLAFVMSGFSSFYFILAMSLFMLLVGISYTILCQQFPDGGGVYSSAKRRSRGLAVVGALLLCADYIITAALSAYEGFRYILPVNIDSRVAVYLAIGAILFMGLMNVFGPRRTGMAAFLVAALCVVFYAIIGTVGVAKAGEVRINLPIQPDGQTTFAFASEQWHHFVNVILALSGVEAIANLTGVMARPAGKNARRAIFVVLAEVVIINLAMAFAMSALPALANGAVADLPAHAQEHLRDRMVRVLAEHYMGETFAAVSSVFFGVLLLSAANTAIGGMVSILYLMGRDKELPSSFTKLNRHGMPKLPLIAATLAPAVVLWIVGNNTSQLADLYAIGVVGAISIAILSAGTDFRLGLRGWERSTLLMVGLLTGIIEITIAVYKPWALLFATTVLGLGLLARLAAREARKRMPVSAEAGAATYHITPHALPDGPRMLLPARGNPRLFQFAAQYAADRKAGVFVLFVRTVAVPFRERDTSLATEHMTIEKDADAQALFRQAEATFQAASVPMIPIYAVHDAPAEVILDYAATLGVDVVLMGVSRKGPIGRTLSGDLPEEVSRCLPESITLLIHA